MNISAAMLKRWRDQLHFFNYLLSKDCRILLTPSFVFPAARVP
jgi:hypothetical protein